MANVSISEGTLFKIFSVTWFIFFMLGAFFTFPFGYVFMAVIGVGAALLVTILYVFLVDMIYGGGDKFNFRKGRPKREDEDDDEGFIKGL